MSLSLIPESAPFNTEQRAWLNGFLAGWLGLQEAGGPAATATATLPGLDALPSSAVATAEAPAEDFPWHDPTLPIDERLKLADGKPIERRLMAAMAQLDCGACGYLCKTYSEAIASGSETSLSLCSPGGSETAKTLKRLVKEEKSGANGTSATNSKAKANGKAPANGAVKVETAAWSRKNPFPATLLQSIKLSGPGSDKEIRHVEIDLTGGPTYKVGDALGVYPTNCDELAGEIIAALGATGQEPIATPTGVETTLSEALLRHLCLTALTEEFLELLANTASNPEEGANARALVDDDSSIAGFDVLDLLRMFPSARPEPADFVASLSDLKPRLYSISSSPKRHAGQVHLTVRKVTYRFNERPRKGVASTMLADRVNPGDPLRVFIHESHGFTIPSNPDAPMIMIGPGTGIAPFRAFIEERDAIGAKGKNWLFFGDQQRALDFLYEDELEGYLRSGRLTRLETAFSRDQEKKIYVQDRMIENGRELFDWLEQGAFVYVCGDAKRMAVDVDRALRAIIRDHGGKTDEAASAYVAALSAAGRYCRDVY
jgi:sulfite reductase (NADPH) flavoprotein alpha-component